MKPLSRSTIPTLLIVIFCLITSCSMQKLKNTIDGMSYQCGDGYNSEKAYLKIHDPSQSETKPKFIILAEQDIPVTEKGCIERPQERIFVTNIDRSAGIWAAPDSGQNLTLEAIGRVDLPAACNSVVHGNGTGFTLNFDLKSVSSQRELQSLEVRLYHLKSEEGISAWEPRSLEPANTFYFKKDKPILSGEYRLIAHIVDKVRNVQSKSECILRLDDSKLYISPADKISDKRIYNGQNVLIVQPGYNLNFYVHEGFRDVRIEYCLTPLDIKSITPIMDPKYFECTNPVEYLKTKSEDLNEGFWMLSFRGQRGLVETAWQHAIFLVEKTCVGVFETVTSLRGRGCTLIRGSLSLSDLDETNQNEMDSIGRIVGNLNLINTPIKNLNAFPNLQEILGSLIISSENVVKIEGFSALTFILNSLEIDGDSLKAISAFESLQVISGKLSIFSPSHELNIQPLKQLQAVEGNLSLINLKITKLNFLRSLRTSGDLSINGLDEIIDLSGLDSLESLGNLDLSFCANLKSLKGTPKLKSLRYLQLSELPLSDLSGLSTIQEIDHLKLHNMRNMLSLHIDAPNPLKILQHLSIDGENRLTDLTDLDFNPQLRTLQIANGRLPSLKGLEKVKRLQELLLEHLHSLPSLEGLENLKSVGYFSLQNTSVSDLSALKRLELVTGIVDFDKNPRLTSLIGLENLERVEGDLAFRETGLKSLLGLPKGGVIRGQLILVENQELVDLKGLNHLAEISKDLVIMSHSHLQNLKGLEGLVVKGNVFIGYADFTTESNIPELEDVASLSQVARIGGALRLNSPKCLPAEFLITLESKVLGQPPEDVETIPEGEPTIVIKQPESCV